MRIRAIKRQRRYRIGLSGLGACKAQAQRELLQKRIPESFPAKSKPQRDKSDEQDMKAKASSMSHSVLEVQLPEQREDTQLSLDPALVSLERRSGLANVVLARDGGLKSAIEPANVPVSSAQTDMLAGTGVLFQGMPDGSFAITQAVTGSPAAAAISSGSFGIGDKLMAVDGVLLHGKSYEEVLGKINGPAGTSVVITLLRSRVCKRGGGQGVIEPTAGTVSVSPQPHISETESSAGQLAPEPADDALVLAEVGVSSQVQLSSRCADCAIFKEQVKVLTQGLSAALKHSQKREEEVRGLGENHEMMLELLQRRVESRDQTIEQLEQQLLRHQKDSDGEITRMVLQIKQLLTENTDLRLGVKEAYSVIEFLESTNVGLKSQLSTLQETRSKADVVSLHNDKILVSLNAVSLERDEALNMRAVVDARNQHLSRELVLQREDCARERAEWDKERGRNLEQIRCLQTELQQLVAQLKLRQDSRGFTAEPVHMQRQSKTAGLTKPSQRTGNAKGRERAFQSAKESAKDALSVLEYTVEYSLQLSCDEQTGQRREYETEESIFVEAGCAGLGELVGGNQQQTQDAMILTFRCDRDELDVSRQQNFSPRKVAPEQDMPQVRGTQAWLPLTSPILSTITGNDLIRSATEGGVDNCRAAGKGGEGVQDADGTGGAREAGDNDCGSCFSLDASFAQNQNLHGSDEEQLVVRLRDQLSFQTQANKDLKAQLDHSLATIQSLNSRSHNFHQHQSSSLPPPGFGGRRIQFDSYVLDLSMHEMLLAERENTNFISHSLSQLSRTHAQELQKLESTRSHCEELAVELNERLVLKEAEIIQLRQQLENAHSKNTISNHTSAMKANFPTQRRSGGDAGEPLVADSLPLAARAASPTQEGQGAGASHSAGGGMLSEKAGNGSVTEVECGRVARQVIKAEEIGDGTCVKSWKDRSAHIQEQVERSVVLLHTFLHHS